MVKDIITPPKRPFVPVDIDANTIEIMEYKVIPIENRIGLIKYVHYGIRPCQDITDFLCCGLTNVVLIQKLCTNNTNPPKHMMSAYSSLVANVLPRKSWGSMESVAWWMVVRREFKLSIFEVNWPKVWRDEVHAVRCYNA
jgi:hypothetical protein